MIEIISKILLQVELDNRFICRPDSETWLEDQPNSKLRIVEFHSRGGFAINGTTTEPMWNTGPQYFVMEHFAENLATFLTIERRNTFLVIRNLTNRLVLTLPQDKHELGQTKFHIALRAIEPANSELNGRAAYGLIFFRQDQLHIDLFVFFSCLRFAEHPLAIYDCGHAKVGGFPSRASFEVLFAA